jgi:hypothetical protein
MPRLALGLILLSLLCASCYAAEQPDIITLKSGEKVKGHVTREDEFAVFIKMENGEERGIAKARIELIQRFSAEPLPIKTGNGPAPAVPAGPVNAGAKPDPKPENKVEAALSPNAGADNKVFDQIKDLGSPNLNDRQAAERRAKELGFKAVPVLLGLLNPKIKSDPELRVGAIRALVEHAPLDQQGAFTLGFIAMKDKDVEVRREAARSIKIMKEDRAIEYLIKFAMSEDKGIQWEAARALREVNSDRAFAALAAFIPGPTVEAQPTTGSSQGRMTELPVGPGGAKMPLFLPEGPVTGTASNISSPASDALKLIAGKDLGAFPSTWATWIREKTGLLTREEIKDAYRNRSIRDKMGDPPTLAP